MATASDAIRNIKNKLLEATSSYEDRVLQIALEIIKSELTSEELDDQIAINAEYKKITEYGLGGRAWREFVKDVKAKIKKLGWKVKRKSSTREPKEKYDYDKLVQEIIFGIGDIFPDGDPHDAILTWCRKNYISEDKFFHEIWPKCKKALKKATGFDDLYDYYQDLIRQHEADNEGPVYSDID